MGAALGPLLLGGLGLAGMLWQASESRSAASKARRESRAAAAYNKQLWEQTAFRDPAALAAEEARSKAELASARGAAYERLLQKTGPGAGWGPGSASLRGAASGIESSYMGGLSDIYKYMTEAKVTQR